MGGLLTKLESLNTLLSEYKKHFQEKDYEAGLTDALKIIELTDEILSGININYNARKINLLASMDANNEDETYNRLVSVIEFCESVAGISKEISSIPSGQ